jgi:hypothetical protein
VCNCTLPATTSGSPEPAAPDWQLLYIEFWLFAMRDPDAHRLLTAARRRLRQTIAELAEETEQRFGRDTGISGARWATIVLCLSNGLALERLIDPEAVPDDLLATVLDRLIVRPPTPDQTDPDHLVLRLSASLTGKCEL